MSKTDLYNVVLNIDEITTKNLIDNGVSPYYIAKFVLEKVLKQTKKGKYEIYNMQDFYSYGKKLIKSKKYDDAIKCFNICTNYNKNDIKSYYQLLIINIFKEEFKEVFKYLDILTNLGVIIENERRYLLYLLSSIVSLDENYLKELDNLSFDLIKYTNYQDKNAYNENRVRGLCYEKRFSSLFSSNKNFLNFIKPSNISFIHHVLISKASDKIKKDNFVAVKLIEAKDYIKAKEVLETDAHPSKYNNYARKLIDEIIFMDSFNELPKTKMIKASSIFEAIDGKNYSLALSLISNDSNTNRENNLIYILLEQICEKIKKYINPVKEKMPSTFNYFTEILENNYYDVENIINKINKILSKKQGIYILDAFNDNTTNDLLNILRIYPNLYAFTIDYNLEKRIVIRYCPVKKEKIDSNLTYIYASWFFKYKQYNECLDYCLTLLKEDNPKISVYLLTAYTYFKLKKPKEARNYFMVLYSLTNDPKYANIIANINGANSKQLFEMDESEFYIEEDEIRKIK